MIALCFYHVFDFVGIQTNPANRRFQAYVFGFCRHYPVASHIDKSRTDIANAFGEFVFFRVERFDFHVEFRQSHLVFVRTFLRIGRGQNGFTAIQ
jgi:hypothetical protein